MQNEIGYLKHQDIISKLTSAGLDEWTEVYRSDKCSDKIGELLYAVMVPTKWVSTILKRDDWDIDLYSLTPNSAGCFMNWEEDVDYIEEPPIKHLETFQLPRSDIKLIVIKRNYNDLRSTHIEISQEFIHHFNLYEEGRGNFIYFDQDGKESTAIQKTNDSVKIRKDILNEYLFRKKLVLVFYFDSRRYSQSSLEELSVSEGKEKLHGNNYYYNQFVMSGNEFTEYKSLGWIHGKRVIFGIPIHKKEEEYQEFIIGTNLNGSPIKKSCYPYVDAHTFLIKVFFERKVLEKYISDPEKYTVSDGYIEFAAIWSLTIDNHSSEYIVVYLGDLGKYLPESERTYWLSYNIAPHGKTGSEVNYKRSLMCEFVDSDSLDFVFKRKYESFNNQHESRYRWYFFKKFPEDEHCFKCLSICDETIESFLGQINNLDKSLSESINVKEINRHIEKEKTEKSISKLGKYLKAQGISNYETHIQNLRTISRLRNQKPHRKGKEFEELKERYNLTPGNYRRVFLDRLKEAVEFIEFLETHLIHQKVNA